MFFVPIFSNVKEFQIYPFSFAVYIGITNNENNINEEYKICAVPKIDES